MFIRKSDVEEDTRRERKEIRGIDLKYSIRSVGKKERESESPSFLRYLAPSASCYTHAETHRSSTRAEVFVWCAESHIPFRIDGPGVVRWSGGALVAQSSMNFNHISFAVPPSLFSTRSFPLCPASLHNCLHQHLFFFRPSSFSFFLGCRKRMASLMLRRFVARRRRNDYASS